MINTRPERVTKNGKQYWRMPDGDLIKYIAGGSNDEPTLEELKEKLKEQESMTSEARSDAAKYRTKLRETESSFEGVDKDEYKKLKEDADKLAEKIATEKGDYETLLKEKTLSLNEKIKSNEDAANNWKAKFEKKVIDDEVSKIANANNAISSEDVITILKSKYKTSIDDNGSVKFYNGNEVATDGKGNPLTVDGAVKTLLDERSYLVKSSDSGAGSKGGSSKKSEAELNSLDLIKRGLQNL